MTVEEFEELFASCVRESGSAYVAARETILSTPDDPVVRVGLRRKASSSDPETATNAGILLGWLMHGHLYRMAASVMEDRAGTIVGLTPAPGRLALELTALGRSIVPRLVEMLTKSREFSSPTDIRIILQALVELHDPAAIGPLLRFFDTVRDDATRVPVLTALSTLGDTGDPQVTAIARRLLDDEEQKPALRGTAALCLGSLGCKEAAHTLVSLVHSPDPELRGSSVRALKYLWRGESRRGAAPVRTAPEETPVRTGTADTLVWTALAGAPEGTDTAGAPVRTDTAGAPVRTDTAAWAALAETSVRTDSAAADAGEGAGGGDMGSLRDVLQGEADEQVALEMVGAMSVLAQTPPPDAPDSAAANALDALTYATKKHKHPSVRHAAKRAKERITGRADGG
ncbi:HEAT repeat domain-containing protein [Nonomuraea sp. NPDC050404]|uniref:HEAT repeat domain-containing protein n=1 Tax=Nonomuraea sp. NPDC050404 TaxID=3155783 RepID=UPI0033D806FF